MGIGHILGIKHSSVDGSIMGPLLQNGLHTLHHDDISSIQSLYGKRYPNYCDFADCTWKSSAGTFSLVKSSAATLSEGLWKSSVRKMVIIRILLSIVTYK